MEESKRDEHAARQQPAHSGHTLIESSIRYWVSVGSIVRDVMPSRDARSSLLMIRRLVDKDENLDKAEIEVRATLPAHEDKK